MIIADDKSDVGYHAAEDNDSEFSDYQSLSSSEEWKTCRTNSTQKLYWPNTGGCFNATEQGPCDSNEILVLRDDLENPVLESVCIRIPCLGYV